MARNEPVRSRTAVDQPEDGLERGRAVGTKRVASLSTSETPARLGLDAPGQDKRRCAAPDSDLRKLFEIGVQDVALEREIVALPLAATAPLVENARTEERVSH